jgi:hypothetical protein
VPPGGKKGKGIANRVPSKKLRSTRVLAASGAEPNMLCTKAFAAVKNASQLVRLLPAACQRLIACGN